MFELDPVLARDTAELCSLPLCRVLLMKDARYPWLILVPQQENLVEIGDLERDDRIRLSDEIDAAAAAIRRLFAPDKMNIAAIGNIVRQLHIHVVGRTEGDPAWPGPVWGHSPAVPYDDEELAERQSKLAAIIAASAAD